MPDFFESCACKGARPHYLETRTHIKRPQLTARMLRRRSVPRCIVAPSGSGKTGLALDYAHTVFGMEHTFWIDASSPSFIRDLDKAVVRKNLDSIESAPYLAVFEDVPYMDGTRSAIFCDEVSSLIDEGNEVLVTCVPACDSLKEIDDRILIAANDLLLSDAEAAAGGTPPNAAIGTAAPQRVAGLMWGKPDGRTRFLRNTVLSEPRAETRLILFVILVIRQGRISDVARFAKCATGVIDRLACHYPVLGIDCHNGAFATAEFSFEEIAAVFLPQLAPMAEISPFESESLLVRRLCDLLLSRGQAARACEAMQALGSSAAIPLWLADNNQKLLRALCLSAACKLHASLDEVPEALKPQLNLYQARRFAALGLCEQAAVLAEEVALCAQAQLVCRFEAAFLATLCFRDSKCACMLRLAHKLCTALQAAKSDSDTKAIPGDISALPLGSLQDAEYASAALDVLVLGGGKGGSSEKLNSAAESLLSQVEPAAVLGPYTQVLATVLLLQACTPSVALSALEGALRRQLPLKGGSGLTSVAASKMSLGLRDGFSYIACTYFEGKGGAGHLGAAWDAPTNQAIDAFGVRLQEQWASFLDDPPFALERTPYPYDAYFKALHNGNSRAQKQLPSASTKRDQLTVNLFGGLDVYVGKRNIAEKHFRRRKTKTLLALLVLNRGREVSRAWLAHEMWPELGEEAALKNLYPVISVLRKLIPGPSVSDSYIHSGYDNLSLDCAGLVTDLDDFNELCRKLIYEQPGYEGWGEVYDRLVKKYSGDLLPSEAQCLWIIEKRKHYRNRLVDALVVASGRLLAGGNAQQALMFAQAALQHDSSREDIYAALMRAQIAANQRTAALQTYFDCRFNLVESLGIDPSPQIIDLYRSIIESSEEF